MDILFAHLLADMVREANAQKQPENLFVLPDGVMGWKKLFKLLQDEHEIVSLEISDSRQSTSREVRPHFNSMASDFEKKAVPFIRVPITASNTHRELRQDLGGLDYSPTIANLSFLEDGKMIIQKYEGFQEIASAFNSGRYRRTLEEWAEKKIKRKIGLHMKDEIATATMAMAGAVKEREDRLRKEYEEKLKAQREEIQAKDAMARKEREKREIEEEKRKEEEERRMFAEGKIIVEERRRRDAEIREKRSEMLPKLMKMNFREVPTKEIRSLLIDAGVSVSGLLNREDYVEKLMAEFPELINKTDTECGSGGRKVSSGNRNFSETDPPFRESVVERINNAKLEKMSFGDLKQLAFDADLDPSRFMSRDEMVQCLRSYAGERTRGKKISESEDTQSVSDEHVKVKLERDALRKRVEEKDREIQELKENLDVERRRTNREPQPRQPPPVAVRMRTRTGGDVPPKAQVQQLEEERRRLEQDLFNMRILYSTTLEDYQVINLVSQGDDGVVLKVQCKREELTERNKVYALKALINYHSNMSMSRARDQFKTEYEVLCKLPFHKNIIKLHAFFFCRFDPSVHPSVSDMPGARSISLFMVMEYHPNSMGKLMTSLREGRGPKREDVLSWCLQLLDALNFLHERFVVHRDMKLDNLLLAKDNVLKIVDFGTAIQLDKAMSFPHIQGMQLPGNQAHQSPEIMNARPGPNRYLHYDKYSVWVAGVLAFELAGHNSPFATGQIDPYGYSNSELPHLAYSSCRDHMQAAKLPERFTALVGRMLEFDREKRMTVLDAYWEMQAIALA